MINLIVGILIVILIVSIKIFLLLKRFHSKYIYHSNLQLYQNKDIMDYLKSSSDRIKRLNNELLFSENQEHKDNDENYL